MEEKQRQFIKDYSTVTPFLKDIFYYGTHSVDDYKKMNIMEKSKYSYNKNILQYIFGDLLYESKNKNGKKALSLHIDHFYDPHRNFLRFFSLKSCISNRRLLEICLLFQWLHLIESYSAEYCDFDAEVYVKAYKKWFPKLCNRLDLIQHRNTTKRLLKDMTKKGITEKLYDCYILSYRTLYNLSNDIKSELAILTDLCINIYPLSICGDHVRIKLKKDYESPFLFKHRHLGQIFNDETIWKLCGYIHNKKVPIIIYKNKTLKFMLPYRIITDEFSGRQYVFVVYVGAGNDYDRLLRIDRINSISDDTTEHLIPNQDELENRFKNALKYSFTGTTVPYGKNPDTGTLLFCKSAINEVRSYFPEAEIESVDNNHMKCAIKVNNMTELKPWLRVNMERIKLIDSSDGTVAELEQELQEWRNMYGSV